MKLVYSFAAAYRILKRKDILKVEVWANCIWVRFIKGSRFISKKAFWADFMHNRQLKAKQLEVQHYGEELFQVTAQSRVEPYLVAAFEDRIECECEDWASQFKAGLPHPCCKHAWAVVYKLGFSTFKDYITQKGYLKAYA